MADFYAFTKRIYQMFIPPVTPPKFDGTGPNKPIKFGILGAAVIAPIALTNPARSHPEVIVCGIAARDLQRAKTFAKTYNVPKVYGGTNAYQELLDDPEIDALPNGLHYEWTMKALEAGKHVLLEKPSTDTADETRALFEMTELKGVVLLEALHNRFHPAIQRTKAIVSSGELGAVKSIEVIGYPPTGALKDGDIRFVYELGGGVTMDVGCYAVHMIRYLAGSNPTQVLSAETYETFRDRPDVDISTKATLAFPSSIVATLDIKHRPPPILGFIPRLLKMHILVKCEGGEVEMRDFFIPYLYHYIEVRKRGEKGKVKKRGEKVYSPKDLSPSDPLRSEFSDDAAEWWTTYRHQLEAFVNMVKGRKPQIWVTGEDPIGNMQAIEMIYDKTGLGSRPQSQYKPKV